MDIINECFSITEDNIRNEKTAKDLWGPHVSVLGRYSELEECISHYIRLLVWRLRTEEPIDDDVFRQDCRDRRKIMRRLVKKLNKNGKEISAIQFENFFMALFKEAYSVRKDLERYRDCSVSYDGSFEPYDGPCKYR